MFVDNLWFTCGIGLTITLTLKFACIATIRQYLATSMGERPFIVSGGPSYNGAIYSPANRVVFTGTAMFGSCTFLPVSLCVQTYQVIKTSTNG